MGDIAGIGSLDRERLGKILRETRGTISVSDASVILKMNSANASKFLARLAKKGWIARVKRGLYVPLSVESRESVAILEDPWVVAARLFEPCYIGGFSAAERWGLTEQIYTSIMVMTAKEIRSRKEEIANTTFLLRKISKKSLFGSKTVWRGQVKVSVSDPSRTVLDLLDDPVLAGGVRPIQDMFQAYLRSSDKDLPLLLDYTSKLGNGAVFKRLGFLMEHLAPDEKAFIAGCRQGMTTGYARLDPSRKGGRLITRWRLWVPDRWVKGDQSD